MCVDSGDPPARDGGRADAASAIYEMGAFVTTSHREQSCTYMHFDGTLDEGYVPSETRGGRQTQLMQSVNERGQVLLLASRRLPCVTFA